MTSNFLWQKTSDDFRYLSFVFISDSERLLLGLAIKLVLKDCHNIMDVIDYDVDVISKLLQKDDQYRSSSDKDNKSKSLRDELTEIGEKFDDVSATVSTSLGTSYISRTNYNTRVRFDLQNLMSHFSFLHTLMDREIKTASCNLKVFREQKEALNIPVMKLRPKFKQLSPTSNNLLHGDSQLPIEDKEVYEKKITLLKEALEQQKNVNKELQNEFNKILDEKENEIEDLQCQVIYHTFRAFF